MKQLISFFIAIAFAITASAQADMSKWKELNDFHEVISQTYHPSEEGNLEPVKSRSGELYDKAKLLATTKIPKDFTNDKVKDAVKRLEKETQQLQSMVKSGASDENIRKQLSHVHDVFHEIVGLCKKH